MTRLFTGGGETGHFLAEGFDALGGTPTFDTTIKHTGTRSLKCVGNQYGRVTGVLASGKTAFAKAWVNHTAWTTAASGYCTVITFDGSVAAGAGVDKNGVLSAGAYPGTGTVLAGVGATAQLALNTWYLIEVKVVLTTTTITTIEVRLNGVVLSTNTVSHASADSHVFFGDQDGAGGATMYFDDYAINDSTGASQTSYPGDGRVVVLLGTADSSRTGFTAGAGGTTSLDAAVNHVPPAGLVLASATNTSQIKDATSNTTDNYVATLQTPTAAGVPTGASVTLAQAIAVIGNSSVTSRSMGLTAVSNPAIAEALGGTLTTAAGTYPTGWSLLPGTLAIAPTVALGTAPTVKIRKNFATTDSVMACLMGLMIEFVPAGVTVTATQASAASVKRTVSRAKAITQAQSSAVQRAVARALATTQGSAATLGTVDSISQFQDAFAASASLTVAGQTYGSNWAAADIVTETITIAAGVVTVPATVNYPGLVGTAAWNMIGGAAFVTMTPPAVGNGSKQVFLRVYSGSVGSSNYIDWIWQDAGGSFLYVEYNDGSGNNDSLFNVAVTAGAPVRVRFRESAGTIFWDYDTGSGWVLNVASKTAASMGFDAGNCVPGLFAGYFGTESASNALFSNFDIATVNIPQAINATQASAAAVVRSVARVKALTQGQAAALVRAAAAVRAVTQTQAVTKLRSPARTAAASQAQSAVAARTPGRGVAASQAQTAVFGVRSLGRHVVASQAQGAVFGVRVLTRSAVATQGQAATPARSMTRSVVATQAQAAAAARTGSRSVTATQAQSPVAHRTPGPTRTATQGQAAVAARTPARVDAATQAQTATVRHSSSTRTVAATQAQAATPARALSRSVSVTQAQSGVAHRTPGVVRAATQSQSATYGARALLRVVTATQAQAGVAARAIARAVSCSQGDAATRLSGKPVVVSTTQGQAATFGVRSLARSVVASQGQGPVVARVVTRALAATQGKSAVLVRAVARAFAGTQGQAAVLQAGKPQVIAGSQGSSAVLGVRALSRGVVASQSQAAVVARAGVRHVSASQSQAVVVVRALARSDTATQGQTATSAHGRPRAISTTQGQAAVVARAIARAVGGSQGQAAQLARGRVRVHAATQTQAAAVARAGARTLVATQSRSVSVAVARAAVLVVSQAQTATVRHGALTRALAATQTQAPAVVRQVARVSACSVSTVATQQHGRPVSVSVSQASSVVMAPKSMARGLAVAVVHVPRVARAIPRALAAAVAAVPAVVKAPARRLAATQTQTATVQHSKPVLHTASQGQAPAMLRGVGVRRAVAQASLASRSRVVPRSRTRSAAQGQAVSLRRAAARGLAVAQAQAASVLGSLPRAHSVAQASAAVSVRTVVFPRYSNPTVTVARRVAAPTRKPTVTQPSAARSARTPTRVSMVTQASSAAMAAPKGGVRLATQATAATRREQLVRGLAALQAAAAKVTRVPARISAATSPTGVVRVANVGRRPAATQATIVVCHIEIGRASRAAQGQGAVRVARPNRVLRPWTVPLVSRAVVVLAVRDANLHHAPVVGRATPRALSASQASSPVRRAVLSVTRSAAQGSAASRRPARFPVRFVRVVGVPSVGHSIAANRHTTVVSWAIHVTVVGHAVAAAQIAGATNVRNVSTKATSSLLSTARRSSAVLLVRGVGQHTAAGKVRGISVRRAAVQHAFAVNVPAKPIGGGETGVLSFGFTGIARDDGVETGVLSDGYTGIVSG